jgi:predicted nucleic acid-binding protein
MKKVFADSGYWIALLQPTDQYHEEAIKVSRAQGEMTLVSSEMVFIEVLNSLAKYGVKIRETVVKQVDELKRRHDVKIIPLTSLQFNDALKMYKTHSDKKWSLVDCSSFQIMKNENIQEALTSDKHFQQAGYAALLHE